jgi:hypothetical protein
MVHLFSSAELPAKANLLMQTPGKACLPRWLARTF